MAGAAAGAGGATAALQSLADYGMAQLAANRNKKEAKRAFERQLYFRSTAYQHTVKDLREAGLNPMLAYMQGATGGSSAPQAHHSTSGTSAGAAFGTAANAISGAQLATKQREMQAAELENLKATTLKSEADAIAAAASAELNYNSAKAVNIDNTRKGATQPIFDAAGKGVRAIRDGVNRLIKHDLDEGPDPRISPRHPRKR